jgi:hypothetical protein
MSLKNLRVIFAAVCVAISFSAYALEEDVGRAKLILNGDNWIAVSETKQEGAVSDGTGYGIVQKSWILTNSANKILALVRVRGTAGGITHERSINFTAGCPKSTSQQVYVNDSTGGSTTRVDCLRVFPNVASASLFSQNFKNEKEFADSKSFGIAGNGTFMTNFVSMSSGTWLAVSAYFGPEWKGIPAEAVSDLPAAIKPEFATWAVEMAKASRESVRSFSGKIAMPAIEFNK